MREPRAIDRSADARVPLGLLTLAFALTVLSISRFEARLFQSQKMETIGKLAGGVAHEFNSILTTIVGRSELLVAGLPAGSSLAHSAMEIGEAATRAGGLTRKLLAYGRQQSLRLRRLDLNQIIEGMESTFHLLIGTSHCKRLSTRTT